jgi:hypothetical protein
VDQRWAVTLSVLGTVASAAAPVLTLPGGRTHASVSPRQVVPGVVVPKHGTPNISAPRNRGASAPGPHWCVARRAATSTRGMKRPYSDDSCAQVTCTFSGVAAGRSPRSVVQVSPVCLPPGGV